MASKNVLITGMGALTGSLLVLCLFPFSVLLAQPYGTPDAGAPGNKVIQRYLGAEAAAISDQFLDGIKTSADWAQHCDRFKRQFMYMLGLWPLPPKTPLHPVVTSRVDRDDFVVENIHFQSKPGPYVTGNLYRPSCVAFG